MLENTKRTETGIVKALERTGVAHAEAVASAGACLGAVASTLIDWAADPHAALGQRIVDALEGLPRIGTGGSDMDWACSRFVHAGRDDLVGRGTPTSEILVKV